MNHTSMYKFPIIGKLKMHRNNSPFSVPYIREKKIASRERSSREGNSTARSEPVVRTQNFGMTGSSAVRCSV